MSEGLSGEFEERSKCRTISVKSTAQTKGGSAVNAGNLQSFLIKSQGLFALDPFGNYSSLAVECGNASRGFAISICPSCLLYPVVVPDQQSLVVGNLGEVRFEGRAPIEGYKVWDLRW